MGKQHQPTHPLVYQCPLCKDLVSLTYFSTDARGLTIRCERCDGELFISSAPDSGPSANSSRQAKAPKKAAKASTSSPEDASEPENDEAESDDTKASQPTVKKPKPAPTSAKERCPKCGQPRPPNADNCARCGLGFANIGITFDPERFSKPQNAIEKEALRMWDGLWQHWEDREEHERFIQYCNAQELLELAAHHYRQVRDEEGKEAAIAAEHLTKILDLVQARFVSEQARADGKTTVQRGKWLMMGVLLVFALIAFYIIWGKMSGTTAMQMQMP